MSSHPRLRTHDTCCDTVVLEAARMGRSTRMQMLVQQPTPELPIDRETGAGMQKVPPSGCGELQFLEIPSTIGHSNSAARSAFQ